MNFELTYDGTFLYNGTALTTNTVLYQTTGTTGWVQPVPNVSVNPSRVEGTAKEETPEQWLRRRVEEVCWRPA